MDMLPSLTETDLTPSVQLPLFEEPSDEAHVLSSASEDNTVLPAAQCYFCGRGVDPRSDSTYAEVRSWVSGPKKDSAVLRQYTGLYADSDCISLLRAGMHPSQKTLEETSSADPTSERAEFELAPDRSDNWQKGFRDGVIGTRSDIEEEDYYEGYSEGQAARDKYSR